MKRHALSWTLAVALLVLASSAFAQSPARPNPRTLKAAEELLDSMDMEVMHQQAMGQMLDLQLKQAPQLMPFRKVMVEFFRKYVGWQSIKGDMATLYAEVYTEQELRELTRFYQTPLGQKSVKLLPVLFQKGAAIGQKKVQENMGELTRMIQAEQKRLEAMKE